MNVDLEKGSLYIATQTLDEVSRDKYHWPFFITDPVGNIVQHHWCSNPGRSDSYQHYAVPSITVDTPSGVYLSFFKVSGWQSVRNEQELQECLDALFGERDDIHWCRNRMTDLSCRTWIILTGYLAIRREAMVRHI